MIISFNIMNENDYKKIFIDCDMNDYQYVAIVR